MIYSKNNKSNVIDLNVDLKKTKTIKERNIKNEFTKFEIYLNASIEYQSNKNGKFVNDNKKLLGDYISEEELWACTSCNACVEECPISINPLSIIMDMRRNLVMEDSSAPSELNNMMSNIENNGAPWPYNQQDRLNCNE